MASAAVSGSFAPIARALLTGSYTSVVKPLSTAGVWEWRDVPYLPTGNPKHCADIFMADAPFPRPLQPVVMFIHGGAWQRGDKRLTLNLYWNTGVAAVAGGSVGVVPNYRLSPEVTHPGHIADVEAALRWVRANIKRYGGDPDRIALIGHSAGAHLAVLLGCRPRTAPVLQGVRAIVGLSGIYNLVRLGKSPFGPTLVHGPFGTDPNVWRRASPTYCVASDSAISHVPMLLMNAQEDFHLDSDAEELHSAIQLAQRHGHVTPAPAPSVPVHATIQLSAPIAGGAGCNVIRGLVADTNHMTLVAGIGQPQDPVTRMVRQFLNAVL